MKIPFLFLASIFFLATSTIKGQNSYGTAKWYTSSGEVYYPQQVGVAQPGPDYGCAMTHKRPTWVLISTCGTTNDYVEFWINGSSAPNNQDTLSFVMWGPFDDTTNAFSQLSSANIVNCNNSYDSYILFFNENFFLERNKIYYAVLMCSDSVSTVSLESLNIVSYPDFLATDSINCTICSGHPAYVGQSVCIVSVDSASDNNKIYWTPDDLSMMAGFVVYRQNSNLTFDSIGTVQAGGTNSFIDVASQPLVKSYTYRLGTIDSCGTRHQAYTNQQTTMHLTTSAGLNGEVNLVWNAYGGYPWPPGYSAFYIFRSLNSGAYQAIDSMGAGTFTYSDLNPPAGTLNYKIGIRTPPCFQGGEAYTFSNRSSMNVIGISNPQLPNDVILFPDPVHGSATLQLGQLGGKVNTLRLLSINGGSVSSVIRPASSQVKINTENLPRGIYILEIVTDNMTYRMQVAVQ